MDRKKKISSGIKGQSPHILQSDAEVLNSCTVLIGALIHPTELLSISRIKAILMKILLFSGLCYIQTRIATYSSRI